MLDHCAQTILSPHSHLYISLEMSVVYHEHHTTTVEEEVDDDDEVNINVKAMGASLDAVVDVGFVGAVDLMQPDVAAKFLLKQLQEVHEEDLPRVIKIHAKKEVLENSTIHIHHTNPDCGGNEDVMKRIHVEYSARKKSVAMSAHEMQLAINVVAYDDLMKDWSSCDAKFLIEFQGGKVESDDPAFVLSHQSHCYEVYKASAQPVLKSLVIGRFKNIIYKLNGIHKLRAEVGDPGIDLEVWNNFAGNSATLITGMDLPMAESKEYGWSSKTNDCYMLGAIHNFIPFYLASPRVPENIYNAEDRRLTTFARELLGLILFGYGLIKHETLGEVFVCVNKEVAARATLFDYETEFKRLDVLVKSSERVLGIQYFTDLKTFVPFDICILTNGEYEKPDEANWFAAQLLGEERLLLAAFERHGLRATRMAWSNPDFHWCLTRAAVLRSTWDYFDRFTEFSSWMDHAVERTRLFNSQGLVRWNIDKHYLRDLAARGLKVPPTRYIERGERTSLREVFFACGWTEAVLKPVVSGAARHTYRVNLASIDEHESILFDLLQREAMMLAVRQQRTHTG